MRPRLDELRRIKRTLDELVGRTTLSLPDGETITYTTSDVLEAFCAQVDGKHHWLLPALHQTDDDGGYENIIRALERSRRKLEAQKLEEEEEE